MKLLMYLSGQVGLMLMVRFLTQWLISYSGEELVTDSLRTALFPAATVGALFFGFRIFDGLTDPIAGFLSDRWVMRGRNRRNLLWYSFALPGVGLCLIFMPTHLMPMAVRWLFLVIGFFVFFVGYTFYCIPYWSLVWDDTQGEPEAQRKRSNALGVGLLIATAVAFVISPILVTSFGFRGAAILVSSASTLLMVLPIYSGTGWSPEKHLGTGTSKFVISDLMLPFKNVRFCGLLALLSGAHMSLTVMTAAAPFIAEHLLGGNKQDVALLLGPFLGMGFLCLAFVPWVSRRMGWERALVTACLMMSVVYVMTSRLDQPFLSTPMNSAMFIFMLGGPMVAVILGLEAEAITSCAAMDDPTRMSAYWAAFNFVVKAMNGLALWICGWLASRVVLLPTELLSGTIAVRAMSISAGLLLVAGGVGYILISRSLR